jgi:anti-anti-sigma factor
MVRIETIRNVAVVRVGGNILINDVDNFEHQVRGAFDAGKRFFVFDFTSVDYICSHGLGVIAHLFKRVLENDAGKVRFCCVGPKLHGIFDAMQFSAIVPLDNSLDDSLAALAS